MFITISVNEKGEKRIVPSEKASIVAWAFEEIATREVDIATIYHGCKTKGLGCSRSQFYELIKNPVYCGKIVIPAEKGEEGYWVEGLHEAIISETVFNKVQEVLTGRRTKHSYKITAKPEIPLRGILTCRLCGGNLTGSASTGRSGIKHFYYHCKLGCPERIKAQILNDAFTDKLNEFSFNQETDRLYRIIIEKMFGANNKDKEAEKAKAAIQIKKYEEQLSNMRNKLANDEISSADFNSFKNQITPKIEQLKLLDLNENDVENEFKKYLKKGIMLIKNIGEVYQYAPLTEKQKIIRSIFKENIIFQKMEFEPEKLMRHFF